MAGGSFPGPSRSRMAWSPDRSSGSGRMGSWTRASTPRPGQTGLHKSPPSPRGDSSRCPTACSPLIPRGTLTVGSTTHRAGSRPVPSSARLPCTGTDRSSSRGTVCPSARGRRRWFGLTQRAASTSRFARRSSRLSVVAAVATDSAGRVLVAGRLVVTGEATIRYLLRLSPSGGLDRVFNPAAPRGCEAFNDQFATTVKLLDATR